MYILIAFAISDDFINNIIEALIVISIIGATVDKLLLAESTSLASAKALVGTILNNAGSPAAVSCGCVDQGVVAEENRALVVEISWFLQAEREAGVVATFVVSPVL